MLIHVFLMSLWINGFTKVLSSGSSHREGLYFFLNPFRFNVCQVGVILSYHILFLFLKISKVLSRKDKSTPPCNRQHTRVFRLPILDGA